MKIKPIVNHKYNYDCSNGIKSTGTAKKAYYYYKEHFKENAKYEDMFGFE